jgi:hypothetical protein
VSSESGKEEDGRREEEEEGARLGERIRVDISGV